MQSILKTLLAALLGLGLLALDVKAKTSVAFTGVSDESDALFAKSLTGMIQRNLEADSSLATVPSEDVARLFDKQVLQKVEVGPANMAKLKLEMATQYYAYGWTDSLSVSSERKWKTFWSVKSEWKQSLRLRVVDGVTGRTVHDAPVTVTLPQKDLMMGPDGELDRKSPLERDALLRRMQPLLAAETAKAISKAVNGKSGGATDSAGAASASPPGSASTAGH